MSQFDEFDPAAAGEEPQSLSLMGGIAGGQALPGPDDFNVDGRQESKRLSQQSFLIGLIVTVVAFGVLAGMRYTQKGAHASSISPETQQFMDSLEIQIANLEKMDPNSPLHPDQIRETFRGTDAIVAAIQNDPTQKQVPVEQVKMNPFTPVFAKTVEVVEQVDDTEVRRTQRLKALYQELSRIEVQSLVGGARARAFIGGELYKVGDTVGSFTIEVIDNRRVSFSVAGLELRPDEPTFTLGMETNRKR
jgi:hypothetical protein